MTIVVPADHAFSFSLSKNENRQNLLVDMPFYSKTRDGNRQKMNIQQTTTSSTGEYFRLFGSGMALKSSK